MGHRRPGPHRSESVESYLRGTRILAVVAVLALAGGIASDELDGSLWLHHALLAGLASSVIVVMLSAAILNEAIERRRRRRWSVLAQYVMLELVRNARLIWTSLLELTRLVPPDMAPPAVAEAGGAIVRDRSLLAPAIAELVADPERRPLLHDGIAHFVARSDEMLGRWAAVMLNADIYAEMIDRHVELASELAWLGSLLDSADPPDDPKRHRRARASAAVQLEGSVDDDLLVERLVVITRLAEQLDRGTLAVALRIVPMQWWEARMGTFASAGDLRAGGN
jgi:hypothetical protein